MGDRIGQDSSDSQPTDGSYAAEGADKQELLPEDGLNIGVDLCRDPGSLQHVVQLLSALAHAPRQFAGDDLPRSGHLSDDPRRLNRRTNVGYRANPRCMPCYPSDALVVADAVLKRDEHRVWTNQRANTPCRGIGVVGLDAEENQIDGTNLARVVRGLHGYRESSGQPRLQG